MSWVGGNQPGQWSQGQYRISGVPYNTSSLAVLENTGDVKVVTFPYLAQRLTVTNDAAVDLRVGFSEDGVKGTYYNNYYVLSEGESHTFEVRAAAVFLLADGSSVGTTASVSADLTLVKVRGDWVHNGHFSGTETNTDSGYLPGI